MVGIHVHIAEESSEKEMLILTIFYHGAKGGIDDPRNLQCLCVHCNRSKGNKTDNTKADLKHRKQTYGEYQRSVYLKQETKNTMNWIREDMKKRDDSDIKKLLGANEEELKPLMSWVKKEAKKRGIIK